MTKDTKDVSDRPSTLKDHDLVGGAGSDGGRSRGARTPEVIRDRGGPPARRSARDAVRTAPNKVTAQERYIHTRNIGTTDRASAAVIERL